jgi:hypothetical protein
MLRCGEEVWTRGQLLRQMSERIYNVLFLCTGNSARSILAESLLNHWGNGRFRAFSAGSFPKGQVHPMAVDLLKRTNLPAEGFRSKSWDEFAAPGRRRSILSSPSATTRPVRSAPSGRESP